MKIVATTLVIGGLFMSSFALAETPAMKQCTQISSLTGDYFAQRLEGKTKGEMQQATPPEFMHTEFFRMIDLAINLAFTFPETEKEENVEAMVYDNCLANSNQ